VVFVAVTGGMSLALSALVEAQTRFAVTLASIGDAVIVTDRQGRVTFLNAVAAELTGWAAQGALGQDIADVFPIVNMYTRQVVENPVTRVLREGHIVGLAMPLGETITLTGHGTVTQVQLHVQDTGSGIAAEQLQQIFEPLYTTKPGGTGLGLYLVQEAVAAHGGQVTVQSIVGQGTMFTITLPRRIAAPLTDP
jgi:PAS domain S-box-containing protein